MPSTPAWLSCRKIARRSASFFPNPSAGTPACPASVVTLAPDSCSMPPRRKRDGEQVVSQMQVKTSSLDTKVGTLSGGNQQKVALGKWIVLNPQVLLLDEPTRGVDVGAKREIYQIMEKLAGEGTAILFVSSEMEEVLAMSDRVLVMHEGRLAGELPRQELSEEAVMRLATGS